MKSGASNYKMWHQREAESLTQHTAKFDWTKEVDVHGQAVNIVYKSDKWRKKNSNHLYTHDFDSSPDVLLPHKARGDSGVGADGGEYADTSRLLCIRNLQEEPELVLLAKVEEFTYISNGRRKTLSFTTQEPFLCGTVDNRTLVIIYSEVIFVNGGRMRITERGIVH